MRNYKLVGLQRGEMRHVEARTRETLVARTETFSIGGGEWSIELYDYRGRLLAEFVGSNGTREGEECVDLWAQVNEWCARIAYPAYSYREWIAPDGTKGSKTYFNREVERGRLHDLKVAF